MGRNHILIIIVLSLFLVEGCATGRTAKKEQPGVFHDREEIREEGNEDGTGKTGRSEQAEGSETTAPTVIVKEEDVASPEVQSIITVIAELEECYRLNNFEKWLGLLTPHYRAAYSDPEFLAREGWKAGSIESFFRLLVETRRRGNIRSLAVSRVSFINPNKAQVYVMLESEEFPRPQHTFIRIGNSWYKGLANEGE